MKKTLIVGVALALAPAFALAADDTKKSAGTSTTMGDSTSFQALDKNKDGHLSQDELKGQGNVQFSTLDKDGDGKVTEKEWSDRQKGAAGPAGPTGAAGAAGSTSGSSATPSATPGTSSPSSATPSTSTPSASPSTSGNTKKQ